MAADPQTYTAINASSARHPLGWRADVQKAADDYRAYRQSHRYAVGGNDHAVRERCTGNYPTVVYVLNTGGSRPRCN
jgi:hypothetical protein